MPEVDTTGGTAPISPDTQATGNADGQTSGMSFTTVLLSTFSTVFVAELGDKTQLATLLLSAQSGQPWLVFVGAALALICSSLVGVLVGRWLSTILPPERLEQMAGVLMVGLGVWLGIQALQSLLQRTF
jgi:putative Ca2+/H+ antiporter (TMEM165/GDT1 family)